MLCLSTGEWSIPATSRSLNPTDFYSGSLTSGLTSVLSNEVNSDESETTLWQCDVTIPDPLYAYVTIHLEYFLIIADESLSSKTKK